MLPLGGNLTPDRQMDRDIKELPLALSFTAKASEYANVLSGLESSLYVTGFLLFAAPTR